MEKHRAELKELSELDLEAEIVLVDWEADDPEVSRYSAHIHIHRCTTFARTCMASHPVLGSKIGVMTDLRTRSTGPKPRNT